MSSDKGTNQSYQLLELNNENDHFLWHGDFETLKQVMADLLDIDEDAAECGSDTAQYAEL